MNCPRLTSTVYDKKINLNKRYALSCCNSFRKKSCKSKMLTKTSKHWISFFFRCTQHGAFCTILWTLFKVDQFVEINCIVCQYLDKISSRKSVLTYFNRHKQSARILFNKTSEMALTHGVSTSSGGGGGGGGSAPKYKSICIIEGKNVIIFLSEN